MFVVGIGASAGGLEALERLFGSMPINTGMSFVVLQHLSPDFESHMEELLSRQTRLPVHEVRDGVRVEPNSIYLIPPRKEMIISGCRLHLTDKDPQRGLSLPIDTFFRSLAQDVGRRSVGVVLSGTGSDGSRGVRAIHEAGGLVITQSEDTAMFDGMPLSAQETGVVDLVLPPEAIPDALVKHSKGQAVTSAAESDLLPVKDGPLDRIFRLLRGQYGIDFSHYKPSTVIRRIDRRLAFNESLDLEGYAELLQDNPVELNSLYKDLLIGVTQFFRDREAFNILESEVVSRIVDAKERGEEIRVWVAGCATGEEAYSIAIQFHEELERRGWPINVKIFATDVHRTSLEYASAGVYDEAALGEVTTQRRQRYFNRERDGYHALQELRQLVVFAPHNLITDAPFTRLDLITCRNLLIYLQPVAQKKVLSLFHFGLRTGGVLFLGPSETPGDLAEEFDPIDRHWKIFRKRRDVRLPGAMRIPLTVSPIRRQGGASPGIWQRQPTDPVLMTFYDQLLEMYMPPSLLVDENFNLMHAFGGAERMLKLRGGRPSTHILDMIHEDLRTSLTGALQHSLKQMSPIRYTGVRIRGPEGEEQFCLTVKPLSDPRVATRQLLISLEPMSREGASGGAQESHQVDLQKMSREQISSLEVELRFAQENLQATIEELETSNEELQATNEELVAANEELQSTNEELHSVNEELYTVNAEYQRKIAELTELTDDMDNLLHSSDVGVIFLDRDLCIRKFTPRMADLFHLLPQDVGRRIDSFAHNLNHATLLTDVETVLDTQRTIERKVADRVGNHFYMRILPYRARVRGAGVVLTLIDINTLVEAEANLLRASTMVESSQDPIYAIDLEGRVTDWNQAAADCYGYTAAEILGQPLHLIVPENQRVVTQALIESVLRGERPEPIETARVDRDGELIDVSLRLSAVRNPDGRVEGVSAIERDIRPQKRVASELRRAQQSAEAANVAKSAFLATISHEIRTPMTTVVGLAELLLEREDDSDKVRSLRMLQNSANHLVELIDDILDISRIEAGKPQIHAVRYSPLKVLESVCGLLARRAEEQGLQLIARTEGPVPEHGHSDPVRLRQILLNLAGNALKFTEQGTVSVTLRCDVVDGRRRLEYAVSDTGPGIAPEELQRLFTPFTQGDASTTRRFGGTGLGLAISQRLAHALGGQITVESELGKGSTFRLVIDGGPDDGGPSLAPAALPAIVGEVKPDDSEEEVATVRLRGRVLLAEDTRSIQFLVRRFLERQGVEVEVVDNGQAALQAIDGCHPHNPYDVVLMDMHMPKMDGYAATRELRRAGCQIPVVALTASAMAADRERCLNAGCNDYLSKPVRRNELIKIIGQYCQAEASESSESSEPSEPSAVEPGSEDSSEAGGSNPTAS